MLVKTNEKFFPKNVTKALKSDKIVRLFLLLSSQILFHWNI